MALVDQNLSIGKGDELSKVSELGPLFDIEVRGEAHFGKDGV